MARRSAGQAQARTALGVTAFLESQWDLAELSTVSPPATMPQYPLAVISGLGKSFELGPAKALSNGSSFLLGIVETSRKVLSPAHVK